MSWRPNYLPPASGSGLGFVKGDGSTVNIAADGTLSVTGYSVSSLTDAGALALSDTDIVNRGGTDYKTTMSARIALMRKTPAGSRTAALPVVLTAADHDKTVVLTGSGGTLSADGTLTDGFYCRVINNASGAATYSGITGLQATTSLTSGVMAHIAMAGATIYASVPASVSVASATSYVTTLSAASGVSGAPVTMSFTPNGTWAAGQTITPTVATLAGSFATTAGNGTVSSGTITPTAGNTTVVTIAFTPTSAAGTSGTLGSTPAGITNTTGSLAYAVSAAVATAYTISQSAGSGLTGAADTLTITPTGGNWPTATITLASTVAGAFANVSGGTLAGSVITVPNGAATACVVTYTPSAAGTASITTTNNAGMTAPGSLTYTALAVAAAYATTVSNANPAAVTVTPTSGAWPSGITLTGSAGTVAGTFATTTAPVAGSTAAAVLTFTPSSAAGTAGTITVTSTPAMTNTSGAVSYTVPAGIPAYPTLSTSGVTRAFVLDANATSSFTTTTQGANTVVSALNDAVTGSSVIHFAPTSKTYGMLANGTVNGLNAFYGNSGIANPNRVDLSSGLTNSGAFPTLGPVNTFAIAFRNPRTLAGYFFQSYGTGNAGCTLDMKVANDGTFTVGVTTNRNNGTVTTTLFTGSTTSAGQLIKLVGRITPGGTADFWVNGGAKQTAASNPFTANPTLLNMGVGCDTTAQTTASDIYFCELDWFDGATTDTDCGTTLMNYLTSKWGS